MREDKEASAPEASVFGRGRLCPTDQIAVGGSRNRLKPPLPGPTSPAVWTVGAHFYTLLPLQVTSSPLEDFVQVSADVVG
jgi:hypothetical protein